MRLSLFCYVVLISATLLGQGKLEFEKNTHDFGNIKEVDGVAEYTFLFVNTGDQPLSISNVKTSCGCTTPFWTKGEVLPGDTGRISARYNTRNRPGSFTKSLTVTSNASNPAISLYVKGLVTPKPRTPKDDLPVKYGAIRMKYRSFNMGQMTTEKIATKNFDVYNDSDSVLLFISDSTESLDYLTLTFEPMELQPKEKGAIKITYDPAKRNDLGYLTDEIVIRTNEKTDSVKRLLVVTTIEEYFAPLTEEELALAPKLTIKKRSHDFGEVIKDAVVEFEFVLVNDGKSELNIRSTKGNCDCTAATLKKDTLQPGEEIKMKVSFDTKGRKGKQFKNITIFSNDPTSPSQIVAIKAQVGE